MMWRSCFHPFSSGSNTIIAESIQKPNRPSSLKAVLPIGYHSGYFTYDPARAAVWRSIGKYLQRFVHADQALLDLGAGYGECSRFLNARRKWALDVNPELARYWPSDVTPVIQSALSPFPFENASLGTVVTSNFFEHFEISECLQILSEIARVLVHGGRLVAILPNFRLQPSRYFDDYTHKTPFTDTGFAGLLSSNGWTIIHSEPRFLPFSMKSRVPKWSWIVGLYLALPFRPLAGQFLLVAEVA
jgi:SAM-dependent methyltransferase